MIKTYDELNRLAKPICGHETYYVTRDGDVYSTISNSCNRREKPYKMKGGKDRGGYKILRLNNSTEKVHRLVALAFIPNPDNKPQVNHIDGDKFNNRVSNLEWCTASENSQHAVDTKLRVAARGENAGHSKLKDEEYITLIQDILDGMTNDEVAKKYGLHSRYVSLVRHKKRIAHVWQNHFKGMVADKSQGIANKYDLEKMEDIVKDAILTDKSNAQIGREHKCDPSQVSRIRHKKKVMMNKYGFLINKYEKIKGLSATTIESTSD